jgi:hypothetical protein
MRCLAVFSVLWFLAAGSVASAQIQISLQAKRSNFLLYERVDLLVTLQNMGDTDIVLDNQEGHPWLSFLVTKHNRLPIRQERRSDFRPLTLKTGETKTLDVNITPYFAFREEGGYNVAAVLDLPGEGETVSDQVPFTVLNGRKIWSQTRSVDGADRVYSLLRFSPTADSTNLYLRVEDPDENVVYTNLALGAMVSSVDPDALFDPQKNLHILQPIGLSTYLYTRTDPFGKVLDQRIFKTFRQVPPRLAKVDDGNVIVAGGLEENPNMPREKLSEAQGVKKSASSENAMQ